jgi:hypothetical protein
MTQRRGGNILIVTLLMLALFATIGLATVYYTKSLAETQRNNSESQSTGQVSFPDDGSVAFNNFLSSLIYDYQPSGNPTNNIWGHSLMRTMYGGQKGSITAYNGPGTFHETVPATGLDRALMVNLVPLNGALQPEISNSGNYVPKNAAYTYPDLKDFYLASFCPATGEVLVPSFHRNNCFGNLNPNNPNWTNATGKFLTPRPRPFDNGGANSAFPMVPPNPDGTFTGDVQNLTGSFVFNSQTGQFVPHNDSIWVDIGLPPMTLANGKVVKPLVAPLILDLDSLLNYNMHGYLNPGMSAGTSGAGMGPWEVNLVRGMSQNANGGASDASSFIQARGQMVGTQLNYVNVAGQSTKSFNNRAAGSPFPSYSAVPWTAGGGAIPGSLNLPGQGGNPVYSTVPLYNPVATQGGYDSTNQQVTTPALYNPVEQTGFPVGDLQFLMARYAAPSYTYQANGGYLSLNGQSFPSLRNSLSSAGNQTQGSINTYRLDPNHLNRLVMTPYSFGLDTPGLAPNFAGLGTGTALALNPGTAPGNAATGGVLTNPTIAQGFSSTPTVGTVTDYSGGTSLNNSRAALGPVDLNRPLADYRQNTGAPLSPTNMAVATVPFGSGLYQQAAIDRQQLAMSIFVRLVVASGGMASYQTVPGVGESISFPGGAPAVGTVEFNALRALAQLAVNIVDYIDPDDISTAFVWNPANPSDPLNAANFNNLGTSVVFGVEKPRLVLTEAYAELTNDPADETANPTQGPQNAPWVRFWLELQNPSGSAAPLYGAGTGPLGDGSVQVYYQANGYSPFQIQIVRSQPQGAMGPIPGVNVSDVLRDPANTNNAANVTGAIVGTTPDVTFDFSVAAANPVVPPAAGNPNGGIVVCTPVATNTSNTTGYPDWNAPYTFPGGTITYTGTGAPGGTTSLAYRYNPTGTANQALGLALPNSPNAGVAADLKQHVVLLQRLANPYMPGPTPTNPYITVDYMDYVAAADRVGRASGSKTTRNTYATAPCSIGKVQPYSSWVPTGLATQDGTSGTYNFTFPASLVLPQTNATTPVLNTFGQANTSTPNGAQTYVAGSGKLVNQTTSTPDTLMTPFDWLPQMDRPLINQIELLHVSMGKPHELTLRFIVPGGTDVSKFGYTAATYMNASTTMLYRALDVLRIQPYGQMTALGGRVPGKVNINTITDKRVWDALFDAQSWNAFTGTGATNDVTNLWNTMIASRTPTMQPRFDNQYTGPGQNRQLQDTNGASYKTPIASGSVYDGNGGTDRPFVSFGSPTYGGGGFAYPSGSGLNDTLLRSGTILSNLTNVGTSPHPYQQAEALRKIWNSTTTVSHSFAVWVTVGYFDFNAPMPGATPVLGAEYYSVVPGDLRRKYFAVVDRSLVGLDPANFSSGTVSHAQSMPFYTTVDGAAGVAAGSKTIPITTSTTPPSPNPPAPPMGQQPTPVPASIVTAGGNTNPNNPTGGFTINNIQSIPPNGSNFIVIGTGATQEIVQMQPLSATTAPQLYTNPITGQPMQGVSVIPLVSALKFPHYPGEMVSSILPGNPGPQTLFNFNQTPYSYVVPYYARLQ